MSPLPPVPDSVFTRAPWWIEARKYDGRLHYRLPVYLVADDGACLWFRARADAALHHVTRGWQRPLGYESDMFFWRGAWYNIYANDWPGTGLEFYCNIAQPLTCTDHTLRFVDLDLDVVITPGGRFSVLDVDEFRAHSRRYAYPADIRAQAWRAVLEIVAHWRRRKTPFDRPYPSTARR